MIKALLALSLSLGFLSIVEAGPALASGAVVNDPCSTKGMTTMADDEKSILACLYNDAKTKLIWKSMTMPSSTTSPKGTLCGFAMFGTASYNNNASVVGQLKCNGSYILATNRSDGTGIGTYAPKCPASYSFISIMYLDDVDDHNKHTYHNYGFCSAN